MRSMRRRAATTWNLLTSGVNTRVLIIDPYTCDHVRQVIFSACRVVEAATGVVTPSEIEASEDDLCCVLLWWRPMPHWKILASTRAPTGNELVLWRRDDEYVIRVNGEDLMGSDSSHSERALASYGCMGLKLVHQARVLVGGLGMGFTLRAALDVLRTDAQVDVAELVPAVVDWNRGPLAHLAGRPLEDRRVRVLDEDVAVVMRAAHGRYDAILLDVDNGPEALTSPSNEALYGRAGLARARRALRPNGVFAVWSVYDDRQFSRRLRQEGFHTRTEYVSARPQGGRRHTIWLAEPDARWC